MKRPRIDTAREAALSHEYLLSVLSYDSQAGEFRWKVNLRRRKLTNELAGAVDQLGYRKICIKQRMYKAHRLAWFYVHREWPSGPMDHINGDTSDNRLENLRPATQSQNMANCGLRSSNTSGFKGIYFHKASGRWHARITVNYKAISLGYFDDPARGHAAYIVAAAKYFGEFARAA